MSDHTCLFCSHVFSGRRRKFCFDCLPNHGDLEHTEYATRYNLLYRACGLLPGRPLASEWTPPGGWPKPAKPTKPDHPCAGCDTMIASTRKWCSPKCAAHNKRHAVRLERAALGGAPLPTPRPATVILDIKPKRFRRKMKELSALMPPVEGISCRDCRGVVTAWWSVYGNTYARLVCYDCHLRRVRAGHATRKSSGQQKRYKDKPSGAIVACAVCGNHFQRTTGRIKACSDVCSAVLAKERDQRRLQRRRTANTGEPYTIRELRERDGDKCWICVKRIDFTLSGMDPMGPTIDHLLPLSHGGADCKSNVKMAHRQCNVNRSNRGEVVQLLLVG